MKVSDLFEMSPQIIAPSDFNLSNETANRRAANKYLSDDRKKLIGTYDDHVLYQYPRAYVLIDGRDKSNPLIAYIMQYEVNRISYLNRECAQQILVWANAADIKTDSLPKKIFFEHLLPRYKTIITDSMQTDDGQRFWDRRISQAIDKRLFVYYVNIMSGQQEITQINDDIEYQKIKNNRNIWGDHQKFKTRRIVISIDKLKG